MGNSVVEVPEVAENGDPPEIKRKMYLQATVSKITLAGAIVDIGLDQPAVIHRSRLQKEPVKRVEDVLSIGQTVDAWVRRVDPKTGRIELTLIKPLDLEWREIKKGMSVHGKVVRLENFGVFVDIGAERPGLVHISELTSGFVKSPEEVVKVGEEIEVKVIGVNRRKKRIRLSVKALEEKSEKPAREPVQDEPAEAEEPVPTAMEMAIRQAMDRAKDTPEDVEPVSSPSSPKAKTNAEIDEIITRTLEQKAEATPE